VFFLGGLFSIFNQIGKDLNNFEHTVTSGLATAYKESKVVGTDILKASEGAGYELGHYIRTGSFVPFSQAEKRIENTSTKGFLFNIPYNLGAKTGGQLAKGGGSIIANTIPFTGTFGHLFAHPHENIFNKASDVAFGILDTIGIGDVLQVAKKPVEEGINVIGNTLAKRITGIPHIEPPKLPLPRFPIGTPIHIEPPKLPIIRTPLPTLHFPHIDIHPPDLHYLVKTLTRDEHAVVKGIQDLGNGIKGVLAEDFVTHYFKINEGLGKIEHHIVDNTGRLVKVGEHTESDIAKILGRDIGGIGRGIRNFFGTLNRFFHAKPVQYGLLGIGIGAPIVGGLLLSNNTAGSTGGTQQQTSPSSPVVGGSPSSPLPQQQTYPSNSQQTSPLSPLPQQTYPSNSQQSSDVLNPYSPQAQYYSALAQTQPTTTPSPSLPTPLSPTSSTTSPTSSSIFSNPYFLVGIAVVVIIIIVLLVR